MPSLCQCPDCANALTAPVHGCGLACWPGAALLCARRPSICIAVRCSSAPTATSYSLPLLHPQTHCTPNPQHPTPCPRTTGGNIHAFTALSPCAVLDVLTPPYSPATGRDCTYYSELFPQPLLEHARSLDPSGSVSGMGMGVALQAALAAKQPVVVGLREVQPPGDFIVRRSTYCGVQLRS